jgi:hypothetical protein
MDRKEATNILIQQLALSKENYTGFIDSMIGIFIGMVDQVEAYEEAMNDYCDGVENGEGRYKYTYAKFCDLLERENKQENDIWN